MNDPAESSRPGLGQAVFLVGGLGSRLGALTRDTPKPLIEVAGRPFLAWLVEDVVRQGVRDILLLCGYRAPQIEAAMAAFRTQGVRIDCSVEPEPRGTGGALAFARNRLDAQFFLLNGDSLFRIPLGELARFDLGEGAMARIALKREPDAGRYGAVSLNGDRVTGFSEKAPAQTDAGLINGGVYWMDRRLLALAPQGAFSLERDLFPRLAAEGGLEGRVFEAPFIDIGVPASLAEAQGVVPAALAPPPG